MIFHKLIIKIPKFLSKLAVPTGYLAFFFKKYFNLNIYHFNSCIDLNLKCSFCKNNKFNQYLSICTPDFDISLLTDELLKKFYLRSIGKCTNCGLIQDYNRPSIDNIKDLRKLSSSKDDMTTEEIWKSYPVPQKEISRLYKMYYQNKFLKWDQNKIFKNTHKKILFLRPTLGFDIEYFKNRGGGDLHIYFADVSKVSEITILKKHPEVKKVDFCIHQIYSGNFDKYNNYFDLIISNHHLVHIYDLDDSLKKIQNLINLNGMILFSDEIKIKPWNPFHYNFYDKQMFNKILKKYFCKVKEINNFDKKNNIYSSNTCFLVS